MPALNLFSSSWNNSIIDSLSIKDLKIFLFQNDST